MTSPTTNELKIMFENMEGKLDGHIDNSNRLHTATLALVKEIQLELRESNGWKNRFIGAVGVIVLVVVPIMGWALYEIVNLDKKIDEAVLDVVASQNEKLDEAVANAMEDYLDLKGYSE